MLLTNEIIETIFEYQISHPIIADKEIIEDIQVLIQSTGNNLEVIENKPIYKFFTRYKNNWILKYTDDLFQTTKYLNKQNIRRAYNRGGIPVFVIS